LGQDKFVQVGERPFAPLEPSHRLLVAAERDRPPSANVRALGFERPGREWVLPGFEVAFEAPGEELEPGDEAESVELASGRRVLVLSIEDLLLWRLREWVHWHAVSGFQQAAHLLAAEPLNAARLDRRAAEEGLSLALSELRRVEAEIETGRVFEGWELAEIGKKIERESYS
jgi:hypothetical protein